MSDANIVPVWSAERDPEYSISVKTLRNILKYLPDEYEVYISGATENGFDQIDVIDIDHKEHTIQLHSGR